MGTRFWLYGSGRQEGDLSGSSTSEPSWALLHPLFLGALVVLVINDHVLKHAGLGFPEITGKLSDFAGLVVAPIALAALFRARTARAQLAAIGAVTLHFVLLQAAPRYAAGYDALLSSIGIVSRTWSDLSDLIALTVLPLTWHILASSRERWAAAVTAQRTALGVALFACVATTGPGPTTFSDWAASAAIVSWSDAPIDVRIRWASFRMDCDAIDPLVLGRLASRELYTDGLTFRLARGETLPLDRSSARRAAGLWNETEEPPGQCHAALLSVDGLPETVVFWRPRVTSLDRWDGTVPANIIDPDEVPEEVSLIGIRTTGDRVTLEPRDADTAELATVLPRTTCAALGEPLVLSDVDHLVSGPGMGFYLQEIDTTADGCVRLALSTEAGAPSEGDVFVCMPLGLVPFAVGDVIAISEGGSGSVILTSAGHELHLVRNTTQLHEGPFDVTVAEGSGGCGLRDPCGAYSQAAVLSAGVEVGVVSTATLDGDTWQLLVTRAESTVTGVAGCGAWREYAGMSLMDAIVVREVGQ